MLRQSARDAMKLYANAQRRLAIARLQQDNPQMRVLGPGVQRLDQTRRAAACAYQENIATHEKEAPSAETT